MDSEEGQAVENMDIPHPLPTAGIRMDGSIIDLTEDEYGSQKVVEDDSLSVVEDSSQSIVGDSSQPIVEDGSLDIVEDSSLSAVEDESQPVVEDDSFPVIEDGSQPVVGDGTLSVLEDGTEVASVIRQEDETAETEPDEDSTVEEAHVVEDMLEEEPVTENTGSSKSQPPSGRATPVNQSDQSSTFSSSEKSTPTRKSKSLDMAGKPIEYEDMPTPSVSAKSGGVPIRPGINWRKGERLEAMDYLNTWFPAKIRAVKEELYQVLIHFDGWNQRYDEWIDMSSERIRPQVRQSDRKERTKRAKTKCPQVRLDYKVGEQVYAKWTDCKMYPAKVTNVIPNGSYEVIFYDGFKKLVQPINLRPMPGEFKNAFEINPVPEVVLKKAKMKLDTTAFPPPVPGEERGRSQSCDNVKLEPGREPSTEKDKKATKIKRKRHTMSDGADLASIANSLEKGLEQQMMHIKSEPASTQTDYGENKSSVLASVGAEGHLHAPGTSHVPPPGAVLPRKAFVVQSDHNPYKCHYDACNKGFRKEHLLDYHIKYYHMTGDDQPLLPKKKKRRKTTSTCSTESDSVARKYTGKKNRNLSTESDMYQLMHIKQEAMDPSMLHIDTGEICTQTSPSKHGMDMYGTEDTGVGMRESGGHENTGIKTEVKTEPLEDSSVTDAEDFLKPDELVNCICDMQEENGLMIQCDVCMCWQHAACFGITERTLPKSYVCFVCENPPGVRESSKYIHEQAWYKTGEIASFNYLPVGGMCEEKCSTVKATHTLIAEIHQLNTVLHSLKLQLHILRNKDEAKLKQWRIDWDVLESLHETMETCAEDQSVKLEDESQSIKLENENQSVKLENENQSVKLENENQSVKLENENQSESQLQIENQSVKLENESEQLTQKLESENEKANLENSGSNGTAGGDSQTHMEVHENQDAPEGEKQNDESNPAAGDISHVCNTGEKQNDGTNTDGGEISHVGNAEEKQKDTDGKIEDSADISADVDMATDVEMNTDLDKDGDVEMHAVANTAAGTGSTESKTDEAMPVDSNGGEASVNNSTTRQEVNNTTTQDGEVGRVNGQVSDATIAAPGGNQDKLVGSAESAIAHADEGDGSSGVQIEHGMDNTVTMETDDAANNSDSTESVIEDPMEVCEKNLISHILRIQAEIGDRLDKVEEEVTMLEAMEACQARKQPLTPQHVLADMPQLTRSIKHLGTDLTKVKKMAVFH